MHASSAGALPARIEALALAAGLGREAAHSQLAAGLDVVLHLVRDRAGQRRLLEIGCLARDPAGLVVVQPAYAVTDAGLVEGPAAEALLARLGAA